MANRAHAGNRGLNRDTDEHGCFGDRPRSFIGVLELMGVAVHVAGAV